VISFADHPRNAVGATQGEAFAIIGLHERETRGARQPGLLCTNLG
jgi:hypothetical protein